MKILHVLTSPRAEGTPRIVLDWLTCDGWEQELLFLTAKGGLREEFEKTGVWQYYNDSFPLRFVNALKVVGLVKKVCRDRKPDLVIAWGLGFSHWVALGARMAGVRKNIGHAGNAPGVTFTGKYIHTWISFGIGRLCGNKVIACSDYVRNSFLAIPFVSPRHIFSVYNCLRVDRFLVNEVSVRQKDFVMVGTFERHKDQATLLRAWKLAQERGLSSNLFLIGDGSLREEMERLGTELRLSGVVFMGSRNDVPEQLARNAYFVFSTTVHEGFGTVLLEALAAGCEVIASDVPACREVLRGGEYGKLVPPADADALSKAMVEIVGSARDEEVITKQQKYAMEFSPVRMIERYVGIACG